MNKEIGKWFMDIAKYVATAVLISSFLGGFEQKWIMYFIGIITVISTFCAGLLFIKEKKIIKNNNQKN
ncbi:MAG: hypothetical protein LBU83_09120 [Bacteroidales bacterium]|jgi:hypothetical protein|nr:hypothetical protein [Bacteroidales bacterium]